MKWPVYTGVPPLMYKDVILYMSSWSIAWWTRPDWFTSRLFPPNLNSFTLMSWILHFRCIEGSVCVSVMNGNRLQLSIVFVAYLFVLVLSCLRLKCLSGGIPGPPVQGDVALFLVCCLEFGPHATSVMDEQTEASDGPSGTTLTLEDVASSMSQISW